MSTVIQYDAPVGVTYDASRDRYRARRSQLHLGYFTNKRTAAKALKVKGISVDNSRTRTPFRLRLDGEHIGWFRTRTDAVKAAIELTV